MFGSIVLEVLIGLVLVYLLLSLVCSTIQEAIASARNWRGKMLRDAVARLFDEPLPSAGSGPAGTWTAGIYAHPLIDALRRDERPPSYIPNAVFADALVDSLLRKPGASTPLSATDQLVGVLRALDSKQAALGTLAEKPARALSLLMERARARIDGSAADAATRAIEAFKVEIGGWYENTMNRTTGWYRRKSQGVQFVIAAAVVVVTNADTVMISEQLAQDPKAREAAVSTAAKFVEQAAQPAIRDSATPSAEPGASSSAPVQASPEIAKVKQAFQLLQEQTDAAEIEIGWPDPSRVRTREVLATVEQRRSELGERRTAAAQARATATDDAGRSAADGALRGIDAELEQQAERERKAQSALRWWWSRKLIGLLVTICAVALGAPFWFQMLEKLVKLRSSGNRIDAAPAARAPADTAAPLGGAPSAPDEASVTVAVGASGSTTARATASSAASTPASEKLDDAYWNNFGERWRTAKRLALASGADEATDRSVSVFLARMAALAYESEWAIRARLNALGIATDDKTFKFLDTQGTQVFAFRLGSDVIVAYRGTEPTKVDDLTADARFALQKSAHHAGQVHMGFAAALGRVFDELDGWIHGKSGADLPPDGRVCLTGHSLGAALATLHFERATGAGKKAVERHELVTFGSPRVGDREFWAAFESRLGFAKRGDRRKTRVLRFVNNRDLVTRVAPRSLRFEHVGAECYIDADGRVHTGEVGFDKWTDFTLLVIDGVVEFKAALRKPIGDHSMDLYVRRLENWSNWSA